ncbi:mucin-binding protein [Lactovum odontotermitis]
MQDIADSYVPKSYDVISVDTLPVAFDNVDDPNRSASQVVNIHLKHATQESTENKEIGETIHYFYENGDKAVEDYTNNVTFTRTVMTDEVTNEKAYGEWASDDTTFDAVTSPKIDGYMADKLSVDEVTGITADSEDSVFTVIYKKIWKKLLFRRRSQRRRKLQVQYKS